VSTEPGVIQAVAPVVVSSEIRPTRAGFLAGGVALLVLLLGGAITGQNGFLELVANGVTTFVPVGVFDAVLGILGPLAKGLLFTLVALAVPVAGALLALGLEKAGILGGRPGIEGAILAAGIALLVAELVVLPLFGQGIAGTAYPGEMLALQVPIVAAAVAYGAVLVGLVRWTSAEAVAEGGTPGGAAGTGIAAVAVQDRRAFLGRSLVVVGGLSLVGSLVIVGSRVVTAATKPLGSGTGKPLVDAFGVTPRVTPLEDFYVVGKDLLPTVVDLPSWRLRVIGLVDESVEWTLDDLAGLPRVEGYRTLQCISNEVIRYGSLIGNQWWAGVRMRDLLDRVGVQAAATHVLWRSADGYTESLPADVARDERTWLVSEMGAAGTALSNEHGFPLRVLIAGRYGMKQPKYLTEIELSDHDVPGYWENRGWDQTAAVRTYSRIDEPAEGASVPAGTPFAIFGIASAGDRGISRVEVSPDDGATWVDAELEPDTPETSELTWARWRGTLEAPTGRAVLRARATDGQGNRQDAVVRPTLPSGATGYARVVVIAEPST
jgi:DMSO/TMAO reductase YedYZ molybdopterin-dependent catalytic subunit